MDDKLKIITYLPIGTIVTVRKSDKPLMIAGFCIAPKNNEGKEVFDYIACFWPEGIIDTDKNLLFNHSDIREILFMGCAEEKEFKKQILKTKEDFNNTPKNELKNEKEVL